MGPTVTGVALPVLLHRLIVTRFLLGAKVHNEVRLLMLHDTFSLAPCSKRS